MLFAFKYKLNIPLLFSLNIFISPCLLNEAAYHIKKTKPNQKNKKNKSAFMMFHVQFYFILAASKNWRTPQTETESLSGENK